MRSQYLTREKSVDVSRETFFAWIFNVSRETLNWNLSVSCVGEIIGHKINRG